MIDDELMAKAMAATGIATKREVVDEALRLLVRLSGQQKVRSLKGAIQWEGDLSTMREGRLWQNETVTGEELRLHEAREAYDADAD